MGFGLLLQFPHIPKLNLRFSKWIMSIVDVENQTIVLSPGNPKQSIRFYPADFHKVFGLPAGERNIHGPDGKISQDAVEFIRGCIGLSDKSTHSLKVAETFLQKDLSDSSSRLEKDCFKMSFVIFVMGHFFAPSTKHDYTSVDYWGAIRDTDNIERFNWCQYAFDALMEGITKLQTELKFASQTNNLMGCHPFLQVSVKYGGLQRQDRFLFGNNKSRYVVHTNSPANDFSCTAQIFLLDNLDMGIWNQAHNVVPRAQLFAADRIKRMINMISDTKDGKTVYIPPPVCCQH
jgi:hypothetical protein